MKASFISSESGIKVGDKVIFASEYNGNYMHHVASVRRDDVGRLYIGIRLGSQVVEYSNVDFLQMS